MFRICIVFFIFGELMMNFLRKFVNVQKMQDLVKFVKLMVMGRIRTGTQDHQVDRSVGPWHQTRSQVNVQELKLRPWQGPAASLPAELPKLITSIGTHGTHLGRFTEDPTLAPSLHDPNTDPQVK